MNRERFERMMAMSPLEPNVCEHRNHWSSEKLQIVKVIYPGWRRAARIFACRECRELIATEVKLWA